MNHKQHVWQSAPAFHKRGPHSLITLTLFVGMGVFVYLVFAVPVYVLKILESLDCVYVLSALLGNTFWSCLDQVLHKSHSLVEIQITNDRL